MAKTTVKGAKVIRRGKTKAGHDYEVSLSVEKVTVYLNGHGIQVDPEPILERIITNAVREIEGDDPPPMYPEAPNESHAEG